MDKSYSNEVAKQLDLLYSFTKQKNVEYNFYAYTTYASLKIAIDEDIKQLYRAVMAAYENTTKLVNSIKSLHHNLGRYYRKITELEKINQILEEHFDKYKIYMDKIYHPLKTDDPVDNLDYNDRLLKLRQMKRYESFFDVIDFMLENNVRLEQESLI